MFNPVSTYRIQFHKGFTFKDLEDIIPYLQKLGIGAIYASPVLEAVPGSMHGYDTVNPARINPEIGTLQQLKSVAKRLKKLNINWIQDIVPNHMAFHPANPWLMDVLEKGERSKYASFFDINWSGDKNLPLMVPFLDSTLEEAILNGELKLIGKENKFFLKYSDTEWPVNDKVKSLDMSLKEAVDLQYYRLCHWEETDYQVNFRRFFTVNSLICLNMHHPETFTVYHKLIGSLLKQGVFQGLRIDHIDGLYDPEGYLGQLRELAGEETYIVIEKILEEGERIPAMWPVEGNTGYDFLGDVNNLFTERDAKKDFTKYYEHLAGDHAPVQQQIISKKTAILENHMIGELNNLCQLFLDLDLGTAEEIDTLPQNSLKAAIAAFLIHCPVYRYYGNQLPLKGVNHEGLKRLFKKIRSANESGPAVDLLEQALLLNNSCDENYKKRAVEFYLRCMQFCGPLMAKGVEDTLMYTYNRFLGHNEVGDSPEAFGIRKTVFHEKMLQKQRYWPLSLNATSTHDTKRGEDVRARLNVLTNLPDEWLKAAGDWRILNAGLPDVPDANDEYFIYQTLAGSYPMPGTAEENYTSRLQEYLQKALREGKMNSSWADPDITYEHTVKGFISAILEKGKPFWQSFSALHKKLADYGIINSLSQLLLKFTCPGIPDIYQGTELWDLSLVDPDNRRPVDYRLRMAWLDELAAGDISFDQLWKERYTGKIKLWLQQVLLTQRKFNKELFTLGIYMPLSVKGRYAKHVFAFVRRYQQQWAIIAIPLNMADLDKKIEREDLTFDWKDTSIVLPPEAPSEWKSALDDNVGKLDDGILAVSGLFNKCPVAFLHLITPLNERGAGVLLPVTSLPSAYGIGDLGPEADKFVGFLSRSRQKYWQLLPLNPVSRDQAYSPYSAISSLAGNTLLISPEVMAEDGLLEETQLKAYRVGVTKEVNFEQVMILKNELLDIAFDNFITDKNSHLQKQFDSFCLKEAFWLDDFALYTVLKAHHQDVPWYNWEKKFKMRKAVAMQVFAQDKAFFLKKVKWQQFIFFRQWKRLKSFAAIYGIKLYGDLPFYVGHDSSDVWANPDIFSLDKAGSISGAAGVPPDYFNAKGQLWGMPVYRWELLKATNYEWWLQRIRKNMEWYDLLRLDHFRAFYDYWEVPALAANAIDGKWKPGPGTDFFRVLEKTFPDLPFIAEDLGKVNAGVYLLRDAFSLPGMKVLQFAFGEDIADSGHIPHRFATSNFVVYTGTHDNNTSIGWYENDLDKSERQRIADYTGITVNKRNVHTVLARLAYGSIADIVILPAQDILGLDQRSRMNTPASVQGNWGWRLKPEQLGLFEEIRLRLWTELYGRI
jgi:malto-oligosyltrehalose synthase/4-alpha-glucanotransferase